MPTSLLASLGRWAAGAALVGLAGCCRERRPPTELEALGSAPGVEGLDPAPYLAEARAIVAHAPRPLPRPEARPGQRVFVTAWNPGRPPARGTGLGASLLESVDLASEQAAGLTHGAARIELDIVTSAETSSLDPHMRDSVFDLGLHGYLASDGAGKVGWVLPSEILAHHQFLDFNGEQDTVELRGDSLMSVMAARAQLAPTELEKLRVVRFRVSEWLEGAPPGAPPVALFRAMLPHPNELTPAELLDAVGGGAEYLSRMVDERGIFTYMYDPITDQSMPGYGMIRHAASIYAMMEAYEELREPRWREQAARAIGYMKWRLVKTHDGLYVTDSEEMEQQKVGGAGVSLLALTKFAQATGDLGDLETMRSLAQFIVHQQYPDGHFRENADVLREDPRLRGQERKKEETFFPGEATLGLVRLYAIDPQRPWLDAARRAADYLVRVRDAGTDDEHQLHDQWLAYALRDLFALTHDKAYAAHSFKIARAILHAEASAPQESEPPDYVGAFGPPGFAGASAARLEALAASLLLSRYLGADEAWLGPAAMQIACFMRGQQFDEQSVFFAKNPDRASGGVRESLVNNNIRIDYVEHSMSGWLLLARLLRDPAFGKPPG